MIGRLIFQGFLVVFGIENHQKVDQKSMQKAIENKMQVGMGFGWLLGRFLIDFYSNLEGKLGPSWLQNRRKWDTKTMSKNHPKSEAAVLRKGYARVGVLAPKNTTSQGPQGPEGHTMP